MANDGLKKEFIDYLIDIGLPENFIAIVEKIYFFYKEICPEEIQRIFVSEYMVDDLREYENLWFFSENYFMEAKRFITEEDLDMARWEPIVYLQINKNNYNFQNATNESRCSLHFQIKTKITADMKASKENCDYLKSLLLEQILPKQTENIS